MQSQGRHIQPRERYLLHAHAALGSICGRTYSVSICLDLIVNDPSSVYSNCPFMYGAVTAVTVRDFSCQAALPACERNSGTWHLGKKKKISATGCHSLDKRKGASTAAGRDSETDTVNFQKLSWAAATVRSWLPTREAQKPWMIGCGNVFPTGPLKRPRN